MRYKYQTYSNNESNSFIRRLNVNNSGGLLLNSIPNPETTTFTRVIINTAIKIISFKIFAAQ